MGTMTLGTSMFLVAVGAIMRYAITAQGDGFDVKMIGGILMIVGIIGALVAIVLYVSSSKRRTAVISAPRTVDMQERVEL